MKFPWHDDPYYFAVMVALLLLAVAAFGAIHVGNKTVARDATCQLYADTTHSPHYRLDGKTCYYVKDGKVVDQEVK